MSKLVFSMNNRKIKISFINKFFRSINIPDDIESTYYLNYEPQNYKSIDNEINIKGIRNIVDKFHIKNKKIELILSLEEIITRIIEIPQLKKVDLDKYINNNISEYFTVNIDEFLFDYRIIRSKTEDKKVKFTVLIAAVPREKIEEINNFIEDCGLEVDRISIYPDLLNNVFNSVNKNYMVLDVDTFKTNITIIDNGEIFVYSVLSTYINTDDGSGFDEMIENITYFLNFYASRHFGNLLNSIYVIGELSKNKKLYDIIIENTAGYSVFLLEDLLLLNMIRKDKNAYKYVEVVGLCAEKKPIYNKYIDLSIHKSKNKTEKNVIKIFASVITGLLLITFIWTFCLYFNISNNIDKYTAFSKNNEISKLSNLDNQIKTVESENKTLSDKAKMVDIIKGDQFDYISILDAFRKGLPSNVRVQSINIKNTGYVSITVNINNSTLDVAKTVIAINKMNIFEKVDISDVKLDDTVSSAVYNLKIKK